MVLNQNSHSFNLITNYGTTVLRFHFLRWRIEKFWTWNGNYYRTHWHINYRYYSSSFHKKELKWSFSVHKAWFTRSRGRDGCILWELLYQLISFTVPVIPYSYELFTIIQNPIQRSPFCFIRKEKYSQLVHFLFCPLKNNTKLFWNYIALPLSLLTKIGRN